MTRSQEVGAPYPRQEAKSGCARQGQAHRKDPQSQRQAQAVSQVVDLES